MRHSKSFSSQHQTISSQSNSRKSQQTEKQSASYIGERKLPTFPSIFLPFMAATAAAASLRSQNSTKQ